MAFDKYSIDGESKLYKSRMGRLLLMNRYGTILVMDTALKTWVNSEISYDINLDKVKAMKYLGTIDDMCLLLAKSIHEDHYD